MKVIDFRARPNTVEYMSVGPGPSAELKWRRWGYPEPAAVPLSKYVETMDAAGVSMGVFTGRRILTEALRFGFSNDYVAQCAREFPDRIIGFAGLDMAHGKDEALELERAVKQLGMRGASLDPRMSAVQLDDRVAYPIYEKAAELNVPVVFTMGPMVGKYSDPLRADQIVKDFPQVNFVFSHAPWPQVNEFLALAYRHTNVYLEPSIYWSLPGNDAVFESANGWLADQVIYASAHPFNPLDVVHKFRARIEWNEEAWKKVTYENAARLLRL